MRGSNDQICQLLNLFMEGTPLVSKMEFPFAGLRKLSALSCSHLSVSQLRKLCTDLFHYKLILGRFPIWPYAKLIATCWLVLPSFNGAAYVYKHFIRPFYMSPQTSQIWYIPRKKDIFSKPDDVLTAAEKYIEEHGTEAFERMISKVYPISTIT